MHSVNKTGHCQALLTGCLPAGMMASMTEDIESDLRNARRRYEQESRAAMARRDSIILRARRARWTLRQISAVTGYSPEYVATMTARAERRETGGEAELEPDEARELETVA